MKIAVLHVRQSDIYALDMLDSVRRYMDCPIVHLADEKEEGLPGCEVVREPWDGTNVMEYRIRHLANLPEGEWLSLDTDMIVQHDLSQVFASPAAACAACG